ncbi:MAG: GTP-binding protein, partial [Candidatus Bathyarchaeota archaeon]|nr:GTP-binding protein [Candidatus Bathyarchaeota archaeon]
MQRNINFIRNFTIISHIDHGKSTLADRLLELTKTVPKKKIVKQYLDKMSLERERGITIKMHPCRLNYNPNESKSYQLNLIDTPGHVDFSYEVSRALLTVEGAVLLVDVTKGIQAQTVANLELARTNDLVIIPAINKIDLADPDRIEETKKEIMDLLNLSLTEILAISAKNGIGIQELISAILNKIPPPSTLSKGSFRALVFDSKYDAFQGVVAYIRVFEGEVKRGDRLYFLRKKIEGAAKEVGYFSPEMKQEGSLYAGEIGYIKTGIRDPEKVRVGDTLTKVPTSKSKSLELID